MSGENILEVQNLTKHFKISGKQIVHAVDGVSFTLQKGKTLGLVGESGCGKSTCARTIIRMYDVTDGKILLDGEDITSLKQKELKPLRKKMQMIFQDPYASLECPYDGTRHHRGAVGGAWNRKEKEVRRMRSFIRCWSVSV